LDYRFENDRQGYLHLARGKLQVSKVTLNHGDGLRVQKHVSSTLNGVEDAELRLADLP
jgi:VCBS repeat-containing protein